MPGLQKETAQFYHRFNRKILRSIEKNVVPLHRF